jgi:hypothetical protein
MQKSTDTEKPTLWTPQAITVAVAMGILVACYAYNMFKTMPWHMAVIFLVPITGLAVLAVYTSMCLVHGSCNALAWVMSVFYIISAILTIWATVFAARNGEVLSRVCAMY